jgi:hypothetical protein
VVTLTSTMLIEAVTILTLAVGLNYVGWHHLSLNILCMWPTIPQIWQGQFSGLGGLPTWMVILVVSIIGYSFFLFLQVFTLWFV